MHENMLADPASDVFSLAQPVPCTKHLLLLSSLMYSLMLTWKTKFTDVLQPEGGAKDSLTGAGMAAAATCLLAAATPVEAAAHHS